eukprot:122920-Rhodomonas_salina.1
MPFLLLAFNVQMLQEADGNAQLMRAQQRVRGTRRLVDDQDHRYAGEDDTAKVQWIVFENLNADPRKVALQTEQPLRMLCAQLCCTSVPRLRDPPGSVEERKHHPGRVRLHFFPRGYELCVQCHVEQR